MLVRGLLDGTRRTVRSFGVVSSGSGVTINLSNKGSDLVLLRVLRDCREFSPGGFSLVTVALGASKISAALLRGLYGSFRVSCRSISAGLGSVVFSAEGSGGTYSLCSSLEVAGLGSVTGGLNYGGVTLKRGGSSTVSAFLVCVLCSKGTDYFSPGCGVGSRSLAVVEPVVCVSSCLAGGITESCGCPVVSGSYLAYIGAGGRGVGSLVTRLGRSVPGSGSGLFESLDGSSGLFV